MCMQTQSCILDANQPEGSATNKKKTLAVVTCKPVNNKTKSCFLLDVHLQKVVSFLINKTNSEHYPSYCAYDYNINSFL